MRLRRWECPDCGDVAYTPEAQRGVPRCRPDLPMRSVGVTEVEARAEAVPSPEQVEMLRGLGGRTLQRGPRMAPKAEREASYDHRPAPTQVSELWARLEALEWRVNGRPAEMTVEEQLAWLTREVWALKAAEKTEGQSPHPGLTEVGAGLAAVDPEERRILEQIAGAGPEGPTR